VEAEGVGAFDRFTSFALAFDLTQPSEANFELGDDGSWSDLQKFIAHGTIYKIYINGALNLTGRVEVQDVPTDLDGSVVRFSVRTKMADAAFASADPKTRTAGVTLKQFLLDLYKPLGYTEKDFVFDPNVSRNLMTGKSATSSKPPTNWEPTRQDQAKVKPPETIFQAADRHLRRFGLMHWDSPDGKIVVGAPDDTTSPLYYFRLLQGRNGRDNNLLSANRIRDWSDVPSGVTVFGVNFGSGNQLSALDVQFGSRTTPAVPIVKPIKSFAIDQDLKDAGFYRPVIIVNEGLRSAAMADRASKRELTNRSKKKQVWELIIDGLSYWDGNSSTPFGIDTVCDITTTVAGGPAGAHLIHRVELSRTPADGDKARLMALQKGLWSL
jgi:prophage tail gpP-like protein